MKYVTFSYDDGIQSDIRFLEILNKYGAKCTFNLNTGLMAESNVWVFNNSFKVKRLDRGVVKELYKGHEIASHTVNHLHLEDCTETAIREEIQNDIRTLEDIFETKVAGFAYPFGTYDQRVVQILQESGIRYARTVGTTHAFDRPKNPLEWDTTCHHSDPELFDLADRFINLDAKEDKVFSIWGHSYEFDGKDGWPLLESIVSKFSGRKDVVFCTNSEALL